MKKSTALITPIALLLCMIETQAGEITGFTPFPGINSVAGIAVPPPIALNNDNVVGASPNTITIDQKDFVSFGPVDIVFDVIPSGGVTEYFFTEGVFNSTGVDWTSYRLELGFGTGGGFVPSTPGDELDFDSPDFDSPAPFGADFSSVFPIATATSEDELVGSGGIHPDFTFASPHVFSVDVPDGFSQFTLRQYPIAAIPEPMSVALLALAATGCAGIRRRKS